MLSLIKTYRNQSEKIIAMKAYMLEEDNEILVLEPESIEEVGLLVEWFETYQSGGGKAMLAVPSDLATKDIVDTPLQ